MPGSTLEQVTRLADELPVEDQSSLVKHLANRLSETQEPTPSRDAFNAKDLYGIWYVASQLGAFSEHAITEYASHAQQHLKWFTTLQNNLLGWLENASPLEWLQLETQDPSGQLKKLHFEKTLTKLI